MSQTQRRRVTSNFNTSRIALLKKIKTVFPGLKLQMQVQRIKATVVSGKEVILESEEFNLERVSR